MTAIFAIAVAIFLVANVAAFRVLWRVHPRRRRIGPDALAKIGTWRFAMTENITAEHQQLVEHPDNDDRVAEEDGQNGNDSDRPEPAQLGSEAVIARASG